MNYEIKALGSNWSGIEAQRVHSCAWSLCSGVCVGDQGLVGRRKATCFRTTDFHSGAARGIQSLFSSLLSHLHFRFNK